MTGRLLIVCLLFAVPSGVQVCHGQQLSETEQSAIAEILKPFESPNTPGGAIGIVRGGEVVLARGIGAANLEYSAANDAQTVFDIASGSKTFTSACVALLLDQGRIKPDDNVRTYIPELQPREHPICIRDMLRCESGIWAQFHIMPLAGYDNVPLHTAYTKEDLLTVLSGQKSQWFRPGTEFQYGSSDWFLLGLVVERVSGQSLAEFAKQHLFEPLGMSRTFYQEDPGLVVSNRAVGHWKTAAGWSSSDASGAWRQWRENAYMPGGSGLHTCIDDMHKWFRAYRDKRLPRGRYLDELVTEGSVLGNRFCLDVDAYRKKVHAHPENEPAGVYRGVRRIQITGGFWGTNTCMSHFPKHDLTVVCLSNSDSFSALLTASKVADILLGSALSDVETPAQPAGSITLSQAALERFSGAFRRPGNNPLWSFRVEDGELRLIDHLNATIRLQAVSPNVFQPIDTDRFYKSARFRFETDANGHAVGVTLTSHENGFRESFTYEFVKPVDGVANPKEYAGTFVSDELKSTYRFRADAETLWLRVNSRRWERLRRLVGDEFTNVSQSPHDQRYFRFTRDESDRVDGLSVGFWRIRDLRFDRQSD